MHAKAFVLAALLALPLPAWAQAPSVVATPLQDLPSDDGLMDRAERIWGRMLDSFGFSFGTSSFARPPGGAERLQARDDFTTLMELAGYKLKEIESSVGLIPSLSLTFGQARELTEADREYIERVLERHARRNGGPIGAVQRAIVRGIVEAGELGGFSVDKVEVDLFPLPRVKFQIAPADAPLGAEASRIMRAIDRLNERVSLLGARQQQRSGTGQPLDLPPGEGRQMLPAAIVVH